MMNAPPTVNGDNEKGDEIAMERVKSAASEEIVTAEEEKFEWREVIRGLS